MRHKRFTIQILALCLWLPNLRAQEITKTKKYLDKNYNIIADSLNANYFFYDVLFNGRTTYLFINDGLGGTELKFVGEPLKTKKSEGTQPINGILKFKNSDGFVVSEWSFKNGDLLYYKFYFPHTGKLNKFFDVEHKLPKSGWQYNFYNIDQSDIKIKLVLMEIDGKLIYDKAKE